LDFLVLLTEAIYSVLCQMASNDVLLSDIPALKCGDVVVPWTGNRCRLVLKENSLCAETYDENLKELFSVQLEDVLGLHVQNVPIHNRSKNCRAELLVYRKVPGFFSKFCRKVSKELLEFTEGDDFDFNLRIAKEWREAIASQRIKSNKKTFANANDQNEEEQHRFLVIINPFAGSKQSLRLYRTIALPIFELSGATIVQELLTGWYIFHVL
jgi:hypothetical protein